MPDCGADGLVLGDGAAALARIRQRHFPAAEFAEPRSGGDVTVVQGRAQQLGDHRLRRYRRQRGVTYAAANGHAHRFDRVTHRRRASTCSSSPSQKARTAPSRSPAARRSTPRSPAGCRRVLSDLGASGDEGEVTRFASLGAVKAPGDRRRRARRGQRQRRRRTRCCARPPASAIRALAGRRQRGTLPAGGRRRAAPRAEGAAARRVLGEAAASGQGAGRGDRRARRRRRQLTRRCRGRRSSPSAVALARDLGNLPANLLPPAGARRPRRRGSRRHLRRRDHRARRGAACRAGLRRDHRRRPGLGQPAAAGTPVLDPAGRDAGPPRSSARASRSTPAACRSSRRPAWST